MATRRGTSNSMTRGSSYARRKRKQWLLDEFGDGTTAECRLQVSEKCLGSVDFDTISVDRHPIPGCQGGKYVKGNIRPSCGPCNASDGGTLGGIRKAEALASASV